MNWGKRLRSFLILLLMVLLGVLPIRGTNLDPTQEIERIRFYSRPYEFDYISWSAAALFRKLGQSNIRVERYLSPERGREIVLDYLSLRNEVVLLQEQLRQTLSDPSIENPQQAAEPIRAQLDETRSHKERLSPFVEQIIQHQMNNSLAALEISSSGKPLPPVLYQAEPDSYALIVSPRHEIRQAANIMLVPDLTLDEMIALEERIEEELDLSALVVGIGGVGLYPSMVIESGSLDWLVHVIGHEWTHNYLTIRPLGANYYASPQLTTINETIADLSADAIQHKLFQLYYPEYLPPAAEQAPGASDTSSAQQERLERKDKLLGRWEFDFREQMHWTRLKVDRLLAEGNVEEAEAFLESRRIHFWENGYRIRTLNQAYFAFHGSYAAQPGGAAGSTGVDLGQQLRNLRKTIPDYAEFMQTVAWRWRLDQFQELFADQIAG